MKRWIALALSTITMLAPIGTLPVFGETKPESTVNVSILGTSDIHGYFMPWDYANDAATTAGSLSQAATAIKEIKQSNKNVVLVDVGDAIQGNSIELFTTSTSHPTVKAFNELGYDTWTLGNHEFDFGLKNLEAIASQFKGTILAGNLYLNDGTSFSKGYEIIEKDGVKIALIGMTTPMIMEFFSDSDLVSQIRITDPIEETQKIIKELNGKVDAMVGIMHMGQDNENAVPHTGVTDIANACPELDVIICGHMHKNISELLVNGVLITEPGVYAQQISKVDLTFEKDENNEFLLTSKTSKTINTKDFAKDDQFEAIIAKEHELAREDANQAIGELVGATMTPANEMPGVQYGFLHSTALNRFLNEMQIHYSGADVVSIIAELKPMLNEGPIRKKDIAYNYTYAGGETTVYKISGKDLKAYMEWSADYFNTLNPGDITVSFNPTRRSSKYSTYDIFSGVNYTIDLTKEAGNRIQNITMTKTGKPLLDEDELTLGMNSYRMGQLTAKGGIFEGRTFDIVWVSTIALGEAGGTIRAMAIDYIKNVKNGIVSPDNAPNWSIVGIDENSDEYKAVVYLVNNKAIALKTSEDGKYINLASINGKEEISASEALAITDILNLPANLFAQGMTKGEFYVKVYTEKTAPAPVLAPVSTPNTANPYLTITVVKDDVLWKIAKKYNTTWQELATINNLKNPHFIVVGQKLLVPSGK